MMYLRSRQRGRDFPFRSRQVLSNRTGIPIEHGGNFPQRTQRSRCTVAKNNRMERIGRGTGTFDRPVRLLVTALLFMPVAKITRVAGNRCPGIATKTIITARSGRAGTRPTLVVDGEPSRQGSFSPLSSPLFPPTWNAE